MHPAIVAPSPVARAWACVGATIGGPAEPRAALSWSTHVRDAIECVLVPATIALLPFRVGLAAARAVARIPSLYRQYTAGFAEGAARLGFAPDPAALLRRRRLYVLLDHVDLYWSRWHSDRWITRHLAVQGDWPDDGRPFVVVFFHWGNGLCGIRHLAIRGFRASLIGRPVAEEQLKRFPIALWYARSRYAASARNGRAEVIYWGGAKARITQALAEPRRTVLGAIDVPPTETHSLTPVTLLGRPTQFTHGLVGLAREQGWRLVPMHLGLDAHARGRVLRIDPPIDPSAAPLEDTMQRLADLAGERIVADPAAWWMWAWVGKFFPDATA